MIINKKKYDQRSSLLQYVLKKCIKINEIYCGCDQFNSKISKGPLYVSAFMTVIKNV